MIKMEIKGLLMDPVSNMPVVDPAGRSRRALFLPIWVGIFEANAIALEMEKVATPRPMTHDLLKNLLDGARRARRPRRHQRPQGQHLLRPDSSDARRLALSVDSRPSDAIALALRVARRDLRRGGSPGEEPQPARRRRRPGSGSSARSGSKRRARTISASTGCSPRAEPSPRSTPATPALYTRIRDHLDYESEGRSREDHHGDQSRGGPGARRV